MASSDSVWSIEGKGLKLDTAADIEAHVSSLTSNPTKITEIDLRGNTIGVDAAAALAKHLPALTNLEVANFADVFTGRKLDEIPPALESLLSALLPLKKLHTVNLNDNAFGLKTQAPLVRFLEKHVPLRHLILNNNGLGPEAGTLVADAISRLAVAKKEAGEGMLETIICGRNRLETGSMVAWAKAVTVHGASLQHIRMVQNGIRQEGIQTFLRNGLANATKLQTLDLQDNTFTKAGATALSEVLGNWTELRELGVGDSLLSARGGVLLGEALAKGKNAQLKTLKLQYNEIDAKALSAINTAMKNGALPKLQRVEINGNKLDEEEPEIDALRDLLEERKGESEAKAEDDEWGLDDLSDLEEPSDDEEDDDDDDDEEADEEDVEEKAEKEVKHAQEAENENVPQVKDSVVDALADKLEKVL